MSDLQLPAFIGIGAPKCATTWLHYCMQNHPSIYLPDQKELHFLTSRDLAHDMRTYLEHFRDADSGQVCGEISVDYLTSKNAIKQVREHLPQAKLIVMVRNPYEQIRSHYHHLLRMNFNCGDTRALSLIEAMKAYRDRLVEPALYSKWISRWKYAIQDESKLLIIFFEDVANEPEDVLRRVAEYIGIGGTPLKAVENDNTTRRGGSARGKLAQRLHSFSYEALKLGVYDPIVRRFGAGFAARLRDRLKVRQALDRIFIKHQYPDWRRNEIECIHALTHESVVELQGLTGRDLSHWLSPATE